MTEFRQIDQLKLSIAPSREEMGKRAAKLATELLTELLKNKDEVNVMFAAAPSQNEFLKTLASETSIDWKKVNAFHMDEYIGLEENHPAAFRRFLDRAIFGLVPFKNIFYIDDGTNTVQTEEEKEQVMQRYRSLLTEHPLDMVLMGIGENGHIAFNDPPVADFEDPEDIKIIALDDVSRNQQVHDGCFESLEDVPTHAYTITIPPMMRAKHRICIVPSKLKADAVKATLEGEITTQTPASILRTKESYLFIDEDAASKLT